MFLEAGVMSLTGAVVDVASTLPDKRITVSIVAGILNICDYLLYLMVKDADWLISSSSSSLKRLAR